MHAYGRRLVFVLAAALILTMLTGTALADVTKVKPLGDGSVEVRWSDNDAEELILVPKMSEDYEADLAEYGRIVVDTEGKSKMVLYGMAPGQSYWLLTLSSGTGYTTPYPYKASKPSNFNEWKTTPKISRFDLREKSMEGRYTTVDYFQADSLEDMNNFTICGLQWQLDYPMLKNARSFLWQEVITDPDGFRTVVVAGVLELPMGMAYVYNDFMALDEYFSAIMDMRNEVPVGTYTFSIYWDGVHVCSTTFKVR